MCNPEHNACLVREVSWPDEEREPELTYECATLVEGFELDDITAAPMIDNSKCCKDYERKDCRKYTSLDKSNNDKNFTGKDLEHNNWVCPDQKVSTSTTTSTTARTTTTSTVAPRTTTPGWSPSTTTIPPPYSTTEPPTTTKMTTTTKRTSTTELMTTSTTNYDQQTTTAITNACEMVSISFALIFCSIIFSFFRH